MLYQTYAKIHLDNIRDNLLAIREKVGPNVKICPALKGNGYGHGSIPLAHLAEEAGMDWIGVATVPEGMDIRKAGIKLPILKFSPAFPDEMSAALENDLTLAVIERENIQMLQETAKNMGKQARVHLKVDTGMGRIGVQPEEAPDLATFIEKQCPNLHLEGLFTHMPVADLADLDPFLYTENEIIEFKDILSQVNQAIGRNIEIAHCANSGDVLAHPNSWMDMVRPGIMIYGYYPDTSTSKTLYLKPGMSFYSRVSFVKKVKEGTPISYGQTWVAPRDTYIATVPVGYADGYNRLFSSRGRMLINGRSYQVAGRVCMDQTMLDLGPETDVKAGDQVVLLGQSGDQVISAYEWAEKLGTITYEVTTQINPRVKRYYE